MGVRISWLMFARNSLLARTAASAASLASRSAASARLRSVMSRETPMISTIRPVGVAHGGAVRLKKQAAHGRGVGDGLAPRARREGGPALRSRPGRVQTRTAPPPRRAAAPAPSGPAPRTSVKRPSGSSAKTTTGRLETTVARRCSAARRASSACLCSVMSSEMPSRYWGRPCASRSGIFLVCRRRAPLSRVWIVSSGMSVSRPDVQHGPVLGDEGVRVLLREEVVVALADQFRAREAQQLLAGPVEAHEAQVGGVLDEDHVGDVFHDGVEELLHPPRLLVGAGQFLGALLDARLQPVVRPPQRLLGLAGAR